MFVAPASSKPLDARDLKILEIIQANGRVSKKLLAHAVGLSLTPCCVRLQRLERDGYIRGYRGTVDAMRVGSFLSARLLVTLTRHRIQDFDRFEQAVSELAEVIECEAMGGGIDYLLKIVVRDLSHYQCVLAAVNAPELAVRSCVSYFVTKPVKEPSPLPLSVLHESSCENSASTQ